MSVHVHRTEETGSEGREGANEVGSGIGVGGGNGDGNGVGGGDEDGAGMGTGTEIRHHLVTPEFIGSRNYNCVHRWRSEANEGAQNRNEDGVGYGTGTGTGTRVETRGRTQDGNGDKDGNENGNDNRIGEGGREAKKRKKTHMSCRRHVGNGRDLGGKRKNNVERKGLVQ